MMRALAIFSVLAALACGVAALAMLHEWWLVGVVADPREIARYHFGSEAMMTHGGPEYRSAHAYASSSLITGMGFVLASLGFVWAAKSRSTSALSLAAACAIGVTAWRYVQ